MKCVDVVGAVLFNNKNEVLCALRSAAMSLPGMWEFPGGKIEPNEDARASLSREIREELDCQIEVGQLVADVHHEYPTIIVHLQTYTARIVSGEPKATEHEQIAWLPIDQLRGLQWAPADLPTVDRLVNGDLVDKVGK